MRPLLAIVMLALTAAAVPAATPNEIEADYVEARTASVFAGACHYNGEVVTTGREAVLAWRVTRGTWNGVDLSGARAVAVVVADDTLANASSKRRSELVVDAASDVQAGALVEAIRSVGPTLGSVERVRRGAVRFDRAGGHIGVEVEGVAALSIEALPNGECCKQPNLVWYSPLVPVNGRRVGFTERAWYAGGVGPAWERESENSAFYGSAVLRAN
jgi:hypothetical protein